MKETLFIKKILGAFLIVLLTLFTGIKNVHAVTRTASSSGNWNSATTWGGAIPGTTDDIVINSNVNVTVTASTLCKSLTFVSGGNTSSVIVNSGITLTVNGAITLNSGSVTSSALLDGLGTITSNSIVVGDGNNGNSAHTITSSINTLTILGDLQIKSYGANKNKLNNGAFVQSAGNITINGAITTSLGYTTNTATFTLGNSSPVLNLTGTSPFSLASGINNITLNGNGSTVNYNGSGNQTIYYTPYNNITLSGQSKVLSSGLTYTTNSLTLGTLGTASGSWGSSSSAATYKSDTYFSSSSGIISVANDTRGNSTISVTGSTTFTYNGTQQGPTTSSKTGSTGTVTYSYSGTGATTYGASATRPIGAGTYQVVATVAADGYYNSATSTAFPFSIDKKSLTITSPTIASKVYDGNTSSGAVTVGTLSGYVGTQTVTATATGVYADANVGTGKTATVTYILANGANGGLATNYSLASGTGTGDITAKSLSITSPIIASKVYDGSISSGAVTVGTLSGFVGTQTVTATATGLYADANVGTGKTVTVTYTLANGTNGGLASNYSLANGIGTGNITAKTLTISGLTGVNKIYDSSTTATVSGTTILNGIINSDDVTLSGTPVFSFVTKNVGNGISITASGYTLIGTKSANYTLTQPTGLTAGITAATLTYTANPVSKVYGDSNPSLNGTVSGFAGTDNLGNSTIGTLSFTITASVNSPVGSYAISGSGLTATNSNYIFVQAEGNSTALTITAAQLTITANAQNKTYGTTITFSGTEFTSSGLVNSDGVTSVTLTSLGSNATAQVTGSPYSIIPVNAVGTGLSNYTISYVNGTLTVNKATVIPIITANDKCYDGNTIAVLSSQTLTGVFSSDNVSLLVDAANFSDANAGMGKTVTVTGLTLSGTDASNYFLSATTATTTATIFQDGKWTGDINTDWNNTCNWACNQLPSLSSNVTIGGGLTNYPIVSTNPAGMAKDIFIANGASVIVTGSTLQIAGNISNSGTLTSSQGTIEMKGSSAQSIGVNAFNTNTLMNLIINNAAGVTLQGALNITGVVSPLMGNFNTNGYLTLLSTAGQTALIDGAGAGSVTGNVNMQRYLSSSFGYKYFSSPFQSSTVAELADEVNLNEAFATLYKYDENHSRDSLGNTVYYSGWTKYTTASNPLVPLYGYAANMGTGTYPVTVTMSGVVNNGALNTTLFNNNRKYTQGFNLVGNPYPSPIDWDASGWTKTNIDNAIYFFNAGNTDRYTGVYSSYVNGMASGNGNKVIAAMQGFFVHVSDGTYPVTATLGVANAVRINNLNPVFKSAMIDPRPTLRLKAGFEIKDAIEDAAVIYFDPMADNTFEQDKDALKLNNTDIQVPNIYTLSPEGRELSINGLPMASDSISSIPVGITTFMPGWINVRTENVHDLLVFEQVILKDALTGQLHDLRRSPDVRFYLDKGKYDNRFSLLFSKGPIKGGNTVIDKLFTVVRSGNSVLVKVNLASNTKGNLMVTNILGQALLRKEVFEKETVEISQGTGVYVITLVSGKMTASEKILMRTDYE